MPTPPMCQGAKGHPVFLRQRPECLHLCTKAKHSCSRSVLINKPLQRAYLQSAELDEKTSLTSTEITCSPPHCSKTSYSEFPQLHPGPFPPPNVAHASTFAGTLSKLSLPIKILHTHQSPNKYHLYLHICLPTEQLSQLWQRCSRARASGQAVGKQSCDQNKVLALTALTCCWH